MNIEDYPSSSPGFIGLWDDVVENYFSPRHVDILTDFDNEKSLCYTYLISLNKGNEGLFDDTIDDIIKTENSYFLEISISREKPLASIYYWRYIWKNDEINLDVSQTPYIEEHQLIGDIFKVFADEYHLLILDDATLHEQNVIGDKTISIYQQYFLMPD